MNKKLKQLSACIVAFSFFQPANAQWICRGNQTGRYLALENCASDLQDDDW